MNINGRHYRTIWEMRERQVAIIDQTRLPHEFEIIRLQTMADAANAIRTMQVRGAPCIGATAAYGVALAMAANPGDVALDHALKSLGATRPTAVNLHWALEEMKTAVSPLAPDARAEAAFKRAREICDEDVEICRSIGEHGLAIIEAIAAKKDGEAVQILTHCNAGWLATVDWGTALAPIYMAHDKGIAVHVWVDETRPRLQGAALTAFELGAHGVPHHVITDNAGGLLMREGRVDMAIVGTDRVASNGDVANKIGTYLKALAAHDNAVPFYVALPHTTIDWSLSKGEEIPIEERSEDEVLKVRGRTSLGTVQEVAIAAPESPAFNPGFDVTPARLVTGFITERGVTEASHEGLLRLYPERS
jgi:methylthioribose-1-phosphate isomerase